MKTELYICIIRQDKRDESEFVALSKVMKL